MYTFCKKYGNRILLRENGGIVKTLTKHSWNIFYEDKKGKYKSIHGIPLRKYTFPTLKSASDELEGLNGKVLNPYGAKNFGYQYIRDKYLRNPPITPKQLYIANIDIETGRDEYGYSGADEARCPITSITLNNMFSGKYVVWGYKEEGYTPNNDNVRYIHCSDEKDMMEKFVFFFSLKYPDIVTGWNVDQYDITYIVNRLGKLFEDDKEIVSKLSPFGIVNESEVHDGFGNSKQVYNIVGISTLDYLALFKKFTYITPENYKLDTIAHLILGDNKLDYSEYSNLQDLYERNYEKFIDYNIKDVEIVSRLDGKLCLFDLILSVAYKAGINYSDVVSPVTTWDVLIYNAIMDNNIVPHYNMLENKSEKFVGAFVKEPVPGMYKWVLSCDLNSLYPHLQMGINISPEKRLSDESLPEELLEIRSQLGSTVDGIQKILDGDIDISAIKKYDVSIAPNGQFYKRDSDGFIPVILEGLYNERKAVKKSMLKDKQEMENDRTKDLSNQISQKNTLQMALKILMNSEYGAMANKYFRYFDIRNAEAVTSSGQLAILWVSKHLNIFLNKILKTENEDYVIAVDTDSVYLNLEKLVNVFIKPITKETDGIVEILDKWASNILEPQINKIYEHLAEYVNAHRQKMVMAREVIANKGFWTGKKRYALNVYDNEGVRYAKPKTKIMGLECVKSSVPEFCRNNIKSSIEKILVDNESTVQDFIVKTKEEFLNQKPENIAFPRGTNNIEKWVGEHGLPKKSCPIHVRGCIVYNNFLTVNNYIDEKIKSGDKVKFCYLKMPNIFRSNVISFPPNLNKHVHDEIEKYIDYEMQWNGTFFKPVNSIMEVIGWSGEKINRISDMGSSFSY